MRACHVHRKTYCPLPTFIRRTIITTVQNAAGQAALI